jgi:dynein heavy chain 1
MPNIAEIRTLHNPSSTIKLVFGSICILLNQEANDWNAITNVLNKENFIQMILNFDTKTIT